MARILNRPMFRRGGSTNEGIMHGLVNRKGYAEGPTQAEVYGKEYLDMLSKVPIPKSRFPMGQIGLNLMSGQYAGDGLLQNIGGSAMGPYGEWTKGQDLRDLARAERKGGAVSTAISEQHAEKIARIKAASVSKMQKDYTTERKYRDYYLDFSKPPKDRYSYTLKNLYAHAFAEYGSRIQDNAYKSEEGAKFMQQVTGVVPNEVKGKKAEWKYEKMDPGAYYFHPEYKAFVQRVPRTDEDGKVIPEHLIVINPYTFTEVRRVNLE